MRLGLVAALFLGLVSVAEARKTEECIEAAEAVGVARNELRAEARQLMRCADGPLDDDCSAEFSDVQSAQENLESAIATWRDECDE